MARAGSIWGNALHITEEPRVENFCEGPGGLCDGDRPSEIPSDATAACAPLG